MNTLITALLLTSSAAFAGDVQIWNFDEETTGQDIAWVSPTAVRADASLYDATTELTGVWVTILVIGFPVEINVTDQVPPDQQLTEGCFAGPAPITLLEDSIVFPAPPDPPSIAADLSVSIDAAGFGHLDATNIVLGDYTGVPIVAFRVAGTVTIDPQGDAACATDLDDDGTTGVNDLLQLLAEWGLSSCSRSDLDVDGLVNVNDLLALLAGWGDC